MISKRASIRRCHMGHAIRHAMGYTVDTKTWPQIKEDYGPYGLMGFDLCNGYADVTSHTQLAAFSCNGLLIGQTRGQVRGTMAPLVRYVEIAQQEWAIGQRRYDQPARNLCWVFRVSELRRRHCTDTRMVETLNRALERSRLSRDYRGSMEAPRNSYDDPASIASAVAVGLFAHASHIGQEELDRLGAESVALTYGSPLAFLPGAAVAHLVSSCLSGQDTPLKELVEDALIALEDQFSREYRQVKEVVHLVRQAITMAENRNLKPVEAMEKLKCDNGAQVLAGAVYAALLCEEDFDRAMIVAVNHSGRSAAVGALAGAILGARMGERELPEFYVESLEIAPVLRELADDMVQGCPMVRGNKLFDGDWDRKYLHGEY